MVEHSFLNTYRYLRLERATAGFAGLSDGVSKAIKEGNVGLDCTWSCKLLMTLL